MAALKEATRAISQLGEDETLAARKAAARDKELVARQTA